MSAALPNRIISASRRTDLPGYHAREGALRLMRLRKPVHSVFFWTRYPQRLVEHGPLYELTRWGIDNPFVHLTVTGLGGSRLEPHVPKTAEVIRTLDPLIEALRGEPRRILWRYDPVLLEKMTLADFSTLAWEFGSRGVDTCIISFPASLSLKGPLDPTYARYGLARHRMKNKLAFALRLADEVARFGITIHACCQQALVKESRSAIRPASCISADLARELHPRQIPLELPKDPSQRRHCYCVQSHDIGQYTDTCGSGCVYCYSKAGGER